MGCTQSSAATETPAGGKAVEVGTEQAKAGFVKAPPAQPSSSNISNTLALGAGCYWGTEKYIKKDFQQKFPGSIKSATVGFMSPDENPRIKNPDYRQVCTGQSGHVEVLFVEMNDPQAHFEELCRFHFTYHDPTLLDRQGNDRGFQYSSWIFCADDEQLRIAQKVKDELQAAISAGAINVKGAFEMKEVVTKIGPIREFTKAEDEHQEYLFKNPRGYCNHRIRVKTWMVPKE